MSTEFSDAVVLVAGATGALGRSVVRTFVAAGAQVIAAYRSAPQFDSLERDLGAAPGRLEGCQLDLADAGATLAAVRALAQRHGRLDALVNTVGGYAGGTPTWQSDPEELERMLALNLRCTHTLLRAVVPPMLERRQGCIVQVAAMAALTHPARAAAYAASKAAGLAMIGCLAAELAGSGVRVNSVLPGTIDTEANRRAMPKADVSRWTAPQAIADVIAFLCSPGARALHGTQIPV